MVLCMCDECRGGIVSVCVMSVGVVLCMCGECRGGIVHGGRV